MADVDFNLKVKVFHEFAQPRPGFPLSRYARNLCLKIVPSPQLDGRPGRGGRGCPAALLRGAGSPLWSFVLPEVPIRASVGRWFAPLSICAWHDRRTHWWRCDIAPDITGYVLGSARNGDDDRDRRALWNGSVTPADHIYPRTSRWREPRAIVLNRSAGKP